MLRPRVPTPLSGWHCNLRRALCAASVLTLVSCAGSTTTTRTNPEENAARDEERINTKTSIFASKDEAALDLARGYRREGHYDSAAEAFRALHDDTSVDADIREQALFDLAHLTGDPLNPKRNDDDAIKLFEQFLSEFPNSEDAQRAREQLAALRTRPGKPE